MRQKFCTRARDLQNVSANPRWQIKFPNLTYNEENLQGATFSCKSLSGLIFITIENHFFN